jgi:hypothetical protein
LSLRTLIHTIAAGALVAAALVPAAALAKPMGIIINPKPPVLGVVVKPPHPVLGIVLPPHPIPPHPITGIVIPPHPDHDHDHDDWGWWHHHPSRWMVEGGYALPARTVPMATPSASGPCTCLTKTYLGDGRVEFADICTKEAAIATPGS